MMIFLFIQSSKIKTAYNTPDTTIESCLKIFFFWKIFIFIYLFGCPQFWLGMQKLSLQHMASF